MAVAATFKDALWKLSDEPQPLAGRHLNGNRQLVEMPVQFSELGGNSYWMGYYYVEMQLGSNREPQSFIVDTGSGIACVPCDNHCKYGSCGDHIFPWYDFDSSSTGRVYNCKDSESSCSCTAEDKCRFSIGYAEGSSYDGFMVEDLVYFSPASTEE